MQYLSRPYSLQLVIPLNSTFLKTCSLGLYAHSRSLYPHASTGSASLMTSPDPELLIVTEIWRLIQDEQTYCESRHCVGGRSACVRLKSKIEERFSEILKRGKKGSS